MRAASILRPRWLTLVAGLSVVAGLPDSATPSSDPHPEFYVTDGTVTSTAVLGNTLYIGGSFTHVGPTTSSFTRVDTATGVPALDLPKVDGPVNAMLPDGQAGWVLVGAFRSVRGLSPPNLAHV